MIMVCGWTHSDVTATSTKLPYKAANLPNKNTKKICGPPGFYKLKMKTGQDTIFCSICENSEIWQNWVDHTFDNMVVLNSISLVENDVLIKWTNKVDKTEKPTTKHFWCPYLEVWLPYKAIWLTLLWLQSGPPVYHHQLFSCCYLKGK